MNRNVITVPRADPLIDWMSGESLHAKRVQSVSNVVAGTVNTVSSSIHAIAAALAQTNRRYAKHAIKQVDRLPSIPGSTSGDCSRTGPVRPGRPSADRGGAGLDRFRRRRTLRDRPAGHRRRTRYAAGLDERPERGVRMPDEVLLEPLV